MGSEVGYSNSTQKISGQRASTPLHYLPTEWFHGYFYYITTTSRYLLLPVNGSDLVEGLDAGRQAAVHAKYLEYLVCRVSDPHFFADPDPGKNPGEGGGGKGKNEILF